MSDKNYESRMIDAQVGLNTLSCVRRRSIFIIELFLWIAAVSGGLILVHYCVGLLHLIVNTAFNVRKIFGFSAPAFGPDWYIIGVCSVCLILLLGTLALIWRLYHRAFCDRVSDVWRTREQRRKYGRIAVLEKIATTDQLKCKTEYLQALLDSEPWRNSWDEIKKSAGISDITPVTLSTRDYEKTAEAVFELIGRDIHERAIATGLAVGLNKNPLIDQLVILSASFELQLHVLSRLGKRPNFRIWREMVKRSLGSLFLNTYLNREDLFTLQFLIRRAAMGLEFLANLAEEGAEALEQINFDDGDADEFLDEAEKSGGELFEGVSFVGPMLKSAARVTLKLTTFSLKTGSVGIQQIATLTEKYAQDMVQGVLSGAILNMHGIEIAATCLALDQDHKNKAPAFNPKLSDSAKNIAKYFGAMIAVQIRKTRELYREKRKACFTVLSKHTVAKKHRGETGVSV